MRMAHLAGVDLNLLPLLEALLGERHVTRAARRVGLSQPAASRGLGRLRDLLGDPLLVRSGATLALTPRAEALREPVRAALGLVAEVIAPRPSFDPRQEQRTIRIAADDYSGLILLTPLLARLATAAPAIELRVIASVGTGMKLLSRGDVDLYFSPVGVGMRLAVGVHAEPIVEDSFVCMVARDHPFARRRPTLERFIAARHALIAPTGARSGIVDDALAARGEQRRIAVALPHFLVMPWAIAASDLVLTAPRRIARAYAPLLPVVLFEPPLPLPGFTIGLHWHQRDAHDPALAWIRDEIRGLGAALSLSGGRAARRPPRRRRPPGRRAARARRSG
jgi:DNA-binding transcriptional LysR family regulator